MMKKSFNKYFILLFSIFFLASCSLIKNPESTNFNKNKYRSHLKKSSGLKEQLLVKNKLLEFENESFRKRTTVQDGSLDVEKAKISTLKSEKQVKREKTIKPTSLLQPKASELLAGNLVISPQPQFEDFSSNTLSNRDWWENDPSDWPWKDIVLAVLLILIILLVIVLLIDILGAVFGSLLGLIVLLLLIYLLLLHFG